MSEKPIARALFVCEKTIIEEGTHNFTMVNCFNLRRVESLPVEVPLTIAAMLANGSGNVPLAVVIWRLEDDVPVYQRTFSLAFPNLSAAARNRVPPQTSTAVGCSH